MTLSPPFTRMAMAAAGVLLAVATACGDSPTTVPSGSTARTQVAEGNAGGEAAALPRTSRLASALSASATFDTHGGSFSLPGTGLTITVPEGAIPAARGAVTISVTAIAGAAVAYEFGPHGFVFDRPITLSQDLRSTNWKKLPIGSIELGYFSSVASLDDATGVAPIEEFIPVALDRANSRLTALVSHFSGYMVTSGRK